jgi:hypothetical protein
MDSLTRATLWIAALVLGRTSFGPSSIAYWMPLARRDANQPACTCHAVAALITGPLRANDDRDEAPRTTKERGLSRTRRQGPLLTSPALPALRPSSKLAALTQARRSLTRPAPGSGR